MTTEINLMNERDVSQRLHVSLALLRRWRLERRGPRFIKVGTLVRYRPEDIEAWLIAQPTGGTTISSQRKDSTSDLEPIKQPIAS